MEALSPVSSRFVLGLICLMALTACGKPRRYGDVGGEPTAVRVNLERAFVSGMQNRQARVGVGVGGSVSSGGHSSTGVGVGLSFSSTSVYLLGGEGAGEGQIFRREIKWGETVFVVPLTPGRTLHLTVQVQGGREGWEAIGSVVVPASSSPTVIIGLSEAGAKISTQ